MRKILLGTTAVIGAALISVGAAQAQEAPTVRIGGYFDFSVGYINDDADNNRLSGASGTDSRDEIDFRSDAEIQVVVTGKAANGLQYGALIEFQVDAIGGSGAGTAVDTDEMYMFLATPTLGRLILGDEDNAANLLQVRAPTLYASGGAGRWTDMIQHSGPARYLITSINDGSDATKIIYLSPQFFGFDFGISFAPNSGEGERELLGTSGAVPASGLYVPGSTQAMQRDGAGLRNELSGAIRYRGSFGNFGVQLGAGAMTAENSITTATNLDDPTAFTVGAVVSAFGFSIGGEYTWGQYSGTSPGRAPVSRAGADDSSHWVIGVTYTLGALQLGGFYGQGFQDTAADNAGSDFEQTVYGVALNYVVAPGLNAFANYTRVENTGLPGTVGNPPVRERDIDAFILGMALAF